MENLVPSDAYDLDETGYRRRMPLIYGLTAGLLSWLCASLRYLFLPADLGWLLFSSILFFVLGFSGGILLALNQLLSRTKVAPSIEAIYTNTSGLAVLPPPEREFLYRAPCLWMKFPHLEVSGVLYIGKEALLFMPHSHQNKANQGYEYYQPQVQKPLEIAPLDKISLNLVEARFDFFHQILHERNPQYLEIVWPGGKAQFAVPQAEQTKEKIERALDSLGAKYLGASSDDAPIRGFDEEGLTPLERILRKEK